jgi:hypothetical protein
LHQWRCNISDFWLEKGGCTSTRLSLKDRVRIRQLAFLKKLDPKKKVEKILGFPHSALEFLLAGFVAALRLRTAAAENYGSRWRNFCPGNWRDSTR